MKILELVEIKEKWIEFLNYKLEKKHLTKKEEKELKGFIEEKRFLTFSNKFKLNDFKFGAPEKKYVNKSGTNNKRVVYTFSKDENIILKFICFNLYKYDSKLCDNCFSFRKNVCVKNALFKIINSKNIKNKFCYKVDISNYFNSININIALDIIENIIDDDPDLVEFFNSILTLDECTINGKLVKEKRGAMAGTPISVFLANCYLNDLDTYFQNNNVLYIRYSDDIIVFADSLDELLKYKNIIKEKLTEKELKINNEKEFIFQPGETWNFLGFEYQDGIIDLADITLKKLKAKIHRKSRAIYRWKIKKQASNETAIKALIRAYNKKFFGMNSSTDLTWSRWYFPVINSDKKLKIIDNYLLQNIRHIVTGRYGKSNYNLRYKTIKEFGFRSLVYEFYKPHQ